VLLKVAVILIEIGNKERHNLLSRTVAVGPPILSRLDLQAHDIRWIYTNDRRGYTRDDLDLMANSGFREIGKTKSYSFK
jgi:hypothetical protein